MGIKIGEGGGAKGQMFVNGIIRATLPPLLV
jgi:hypothetical protein